MAAAKASSPPSLQPVRLANADDTRQLKLWSDELNAALKLGTARIQGYTVPVPAKANDGQPLVFSQSANNGAGGFLYGAASYDALLVAVRRLCDQNNVKPP